MRRLVLGFDFETTGLDSVNDRITEVGAVLYHWEDKTPVQLYSALVWHDEKRPDLSMEVSNLTGITNAHLDDFAVPTTDALNALFAMAGKADFIMAHNAQFDCDFMKFEAMRLGRPYQSEFKKPIIDTTTDIEFDAFKHKSKSLTYLAATHGFLNPFAHRALFDVMTMLNIASNYDLDQMAERARSPNVILTAMVSYDDRELARKHGFYWKPEVKAWQKRIKQCDMKDDFGFGFRTKADTEQKGTT